MKYDVVYYKNGKRFVRMDDFDTFEEAEEIAEAATQGWQIKHVVEKHPEPKTSAKGLIAKGLVTVAEMFIVAVLGGYGRRD